MDKIFFEITSGSQRKQWGFLALILVIVAVSWMGFLDRFSTAYIDEALLQSTVAFVIAKGLNSIISVLQTTTLSFSFFGGGSISVGESLDPINDLVEQYSSMMKFSIGSLVIQKLLVEITASLFFKVLISVFALLLAVGLFVKEQLYTNVLAKAFLFLVFLRFALVFVIVMNSWVDKAFIDEKIQQDIVQLQTLESDAQALQKVTVEEAQIIKSELRVLEQQKTRVLIEQDTYRLQSNQLNQAMAQQKQQIDGRKNQLSLVEKYNYLNRDAQLNQLEAEFSKLQTQLEQAVGKLKELDIALKRIDSSAQETASRLEGKAENIFEKIGSGFSTLSTRVTQIQEKFSEASESMLNLMALFFFRTLLLPLLFLYFLMKATRLIWGVDVQKMLSRSSKTLETNAV